MSTVSNTINAVSQQVSLYVADGQTALVPIDGTFTGTLSFTLNQGTGPSAVLLTNTQTQGTASSATAASLWQFAPGAGAGGILTIQASAWSSGAAIVGITISGS